MIHVIGMRKKRKRRMWSRYSSGRFRLKCMYFAYVEPSNGNSRLLLNASEEFILYASSYRVKCKERDNQPTANKRQWCLLFREYFIKIIGKVRDYLSFKYFLIQSFSN